MQRPWWGKACGFRQNGTCGRNQTSGTVGQYDYLALWEREGIMVIRSVDVSIRDIVAGRVARLCLATLMDRRDGYLEVGLAAAHTKAAVETEALLGHPCNSRGVAQGNLTYQPCAAAFWPFSN